MCVPPPAVHSSGAPGLRFSASKERVLPPERGSAVGRGRVSASASVSCVVSPVLALLLLSPGGATAGERGPPCRSGYPLTAQPSASRPLPGSAG